MMTKEFSDWLAKYGLTEAFTTQAGDTLYTNVQKKFGVLKKSGEYGVRSFYLDDITGFKVFDDENLVVDWNYATTWRALSRSTSFSTNEVYMNIRLKDQSVIQLQIFKAVNGNISRSSHVHADLYNYACQIAQIVYNCANAK